MKNKLICILILAVCAAVVTVQAVYVDKACGDVLEKLKQTAEAAERGEEEAKKAYGELKEIWDVSRKWLCVLASHESLHDISIIISGISYYLDSGRTEAALRQIDLAKAYVREFREDERVTAGNIF